MQSIFVNAQLPLVVQRVLDRVLNKIHMQALTDEMQIYGQQIGFEVTDTKTVITHPPPMWRIKARSAALSYYVRHAQATEMEIFEHTKQQLWKHVLGGMQARMMATIRYMNSAIYEVGTPELRVQDGIVL